MKNLFISLFFLAAVFMIGCERSQSTEPEDAEFNSTQRTLQKTIYDNIVEGNEKLSAAFNNQDAEAMAALYTIDGQLLPPNFDLVDGRSAIETFWGTLFNLGFDGVILEIQEVSGNGSTAYEVGLFTLFFEGQVFDSGKYVVVWKKVQGNWYLHRDIWNSSNPAQ